MSLPPESNTSRKRPRRVQLHDSRTYPRSSRLGFFGFTITLSYLTPSPLCWSVVHWFRRTSDEQSIFDPGSHLSYSTISFMDWFLGLSWVTKFCQGFIIKFKIPFVLSCLQQSLTSVERFRKILVWSKVTGLGYPVTPTYDVSILEILSNRTTQPWLRLYLEIKSLKDRKGTTWTKVLHVLFLLFMSLVETNTKPQNNGRRREFNL